MKKIFILLFALCLMGCVNLQVKERVKEFECPAANSCTYFVSCESGESLTGGGFRLNDPGVGVLDIWASNPEIGKNSWRVTTMNKDSQTIKFSISDGSMISSLQMHTEVNRILKLCRPASSMIYLYVGSESDVKSTVVS